MVKQDLFQNQDSGSIPTSPLQLLIREIKYITAKDFYKQWHYLGNKGFLASINYGAYYKGQLMGTISFGIPNAPNIKGIYTQKTQSYFMELTRLAMNDGCPKNSESRFIAIALSLLKKKQKHLNIPKKKD